MLRLDTAASQVASALEPAFLAMPFCVALACVVSLLSPGASVGWAANFVDLNAIDPAMGSGNVLGISNTVAGTTLVTGYAYGHHPFYFTYTGGATGTLANLGTQIWAGDGSTNMCSATAINASGQITASSWPGQFHGFLYSGGTNGTSQELLFSGNNTGNNSPNAIDDLGQVVGSAAVTDSTAAAFLYSGGTMYNLGIPQGGLYTNYYSSATDFNSRGQVVGFVVANNSTTPEDKEAAVWSYTLTGGTLHVTSIADIDPALGNYHGSVALSVNDAGYVVGNYKDSGPNGVASNDATFLYNINTGTMKDLGNLRFVVPFSPWPTNVGAGDSNLVNNQGEVAGEDAVTKHAVLYNIATGTLTDLNQIYASILPAGFTLTAATGINDAGIIIGQGVAADGTTHMFLLTPALPGDANLDGRVDINDLTTVLTHFGQTAGMTWSTGDFNLDGKVDVNDLTIVLANFGEHDSTSAVSIAAVPEPGTLLVLATALAGLGAYGWRKRN